MWFVYIFLMFSSFFLNATDELSHGVERYVREYFKNYQLDVSHINFKIQPEKFHQGDDNYVDPTTGKLIAHYALGAPILTPNCIYIEQEIIDAIRKNGKLSPAQAHQLIMRVGIFYCSKKLAYQNKQSLIGAACAVLMGGTVTSAWGCGIALSSTRYFDRVITENVKSEYLYDPFGRGFFYVNHYQVSPSLMEIKANELRTAEVYAGIAGILAVAWMSLYAYNYIKYQEFFKDGLEYPDIFERTDQFARNILTA